jgi:hypothetical protein
MNDCRTIRAMISEAFDGGGELPIPEIASHLDGCADCRDFQNGATALDSRLSRSVSMDEASGVEASVPAGMHERIMIAVGETGVSKLVPFRRWPMLAGLGVAAALLLAVLMTLDKGSGDSGQPVAGADQPELADPSLPSGFEIPVDVVGLTAVAERRLVVALESEAEAIRSDVGKLRDFLGSRFHGVSGLGS